MSDVSLVPVDHQPDFEDVSLVPVDHDPFSSEDMNQQGPTPLAQIPRQSPQTQPQVQQPQTQTQPVQPEPQRQQLAAGVGRLYIGRPANNTRASEAGESWDPDIGSSGTSGLSRSAASTPAQDKPAYDWSYYNQPFGELKPATFTPTQRIGYLAADALISLGVQPYYANDLTERIGNLLGLTPLGVAGSALDLIDAKRRDDLSGAIIAAAGMIPGAKGVGRGVAEAVHLHHAWPKYLGGAVKQDLVPLAKSLHYAFHSGLDQKLPKRRGTAFYENLGPTERQQALQHLAAYTKNFDAEHGTKLYDALLKSGFPAP